MGRRATGAVDWRGNPGRWHARLTVKDAQGRPHRVWVDIERADLPRTPQGKAEAKRIAARHATLAKTKTYVGDGKPLPKKKPSRKEQLRDQAREGLVGNYFHTWTKDDQGQRVMHWQGVILAEPRAGTYLAQLFSWADGRPTERHLVDLDQLREWTLYPDGEEMEIAYENFDRARAAILSTQDVDLLNRERKAEARDAQRLHGLREIVQRTLQGAADDFEDDQREDGDTP